MKATKEELMRTIVLYDNRKHDEVAPARAVVCSPDGFLFRGKRIVATDTAMRQLCATCGIPADFFCNTMNSSERTFVFNRLNLEQPETERMYRFHDDTLYGVVSHRYKRIDNIRLLDVLEAADDAGIGLKPVRWNLDPDHTRVVLVPERAHVGELTPSITLTNSENSLASLTLWAGVYRWICTNGLMVQVGDLTKTRWFHIGNNDIRLPDIHVVLNRAQEVTETLYATRRRYLSVGDKAEIVTDVAASLGQRVAEKVVEIGNREYRGGCTMFDAVNAVTRAAQAFRPAEQSQVESYAGRLLLAA